jgi:hypothetical protein
MCVVSMVFDHYQPLIPHWPPAPMQPWQPSPLVAPLPQFDPVFAEKLIEQFKEALEAAKKVDKLTGQPDCADPEKEKLLLRVAALENELRAMKKRTKKRATRKAAKK